MSDLLVDSSATFGLSAHHDEVVYRYVVDKGAEAEPDHDYYLFSTRRHD